MKKKQRGKREPRRPPKSQPARKKQKMNDKGEEDTEVKGLEEKRIEDEKRNTDLRKRKTPDQEKAEMRREGEENDRERNERKQRAETKKNDFKTKWIQTRLQDSIKKLGEKGKVEWSKEEKLRRVELAEVREKLWTKWRGREEDTGSTKKGENVSKEKILADRLDK